jgi:two-component system sensor histidine kinase HydH
MLVEESERVCMLARNLLEVARSTGAEQEPLDLAAVIADMLCLVRNDMKTSNVRVEERIEPDLPPVLGSRGRLKQALLNLLVNARQAMPKGGQVTLRVERDGDGRVAIRVADTGVGIPPENMERIFEPYFTTKENGTGLGLPVTRRIVEEHGGTLGVTSQAGAGTEFVIRLPVAGR